MIISASRRTDIPAFYSEWFINRIHEGFVCVRNPMNKQMISRISLAQDVVDGIVFWTKNPTPMIPELNDLKSYTYYFQFTLNAYGKEIETAVPSKNHVLIPAFKELSQKIGAERIIWRYDPIFLTQQYTLDYHVHYFEEIARRLSGYTLKCVISFLDLYQNTRENMQGSGLRSMTEKEMYELAGRIADIARKYHLVVESCAETIPLEQFGIAHGHCIDGALLERLSGQKLELTKDANQREACGCVSSIDIGAYQTCTNGCLYCYANHDLNAARAGSERHDPCSPLLLGQIGSEDRVIVREVKSCRQSQMRMFD